MRFTLYITTFLFLITSSVHADIFTCTNAKGEKIFTDVPSQCVDAEEVKVDSLPALNSSKAVSTSSGNQNIKPAEEKNTYTELVITSPLSDAVLRDNQGNLTINFRSSPALQTRKGHKYVVTLDGKDVYSGTSTITALTNLDRGTHTINAKIVDSSGKVMITSATVKATLQRFSSLQSSEQNNANDGDGNNSGGNTNSQAFPSNTKFPTRPPPASN